MPPDPPEGYVTSAVARRVLGISDRTLRRRVQTGQIDGEYVARAQGTVLYVRLSENVASRGSAVSNQEGTQAAKAASDTAAPPESLSEPPAAILRLLDTVDRQGREIADLSRRLGAAEATAAMLERQRSDLARWLDEAHAEIAKLRRRRWWTPWR